MENQSVSALLGKTFGSLRTLRPRLLLRLQLSVLLKAQTPTAAISWALDCSQETVLLWKQRIEAEPDDLVKALSERERSGRPLIYDDDAQTRIIALFCQKNLFLNGCASWSLRWAEVYLNILADKHDIDVEDVRNGKEVAPESPELSFGGLRPDHATIARILRERALQPHRNTYFLQISDPDFFPKMEHLIHLYNHPPEHLYCFDQITGLQALSRVAPDSSVQPHAPARQDFEYVRHGTLSVFAFMEYQSGQIFLRDIPDTKTVSIIEVLTEHIHQFASDQDIHYVCDNLAGHSTLALCEQVALLCDVSLPTDFKNSTQVERRDWLQSTEKRIVFHFTPFHGSWLNLIEVWFGILKGKTIRGASFCDVEELKQAVIAFAQTWNTYFAHPFNWTYTGEGLHELVIKRNITWLENEASQFTTKFYSRQMLLILHIFESYRQKVKPDLWGKLFQTIKDKDAFIESVLLEDRAHEADARERLEKLRAQLAQIYFLFANNITSSSVILLVIFICDQQGKLLRQSLGISNCVPESVNF